MSTVTLVEQRPPFIVMLASRVPTYTHVIISFLAVLLIQAFPSWAIPKPPVREVSRKRRSSSVSSNASTLVDPDESNVAKKGMSEKPKLKPHRASFVNKISFNKLNPSIKLANPFNKSMKSKLSRRLSLPARRFSLHIVDALHNLTPRHRHPQEKIDSYFPNEKDNAGDVNVTTCNVVQGDKPENSTPKLVLVSVAEIAQSEKAEGDEENIMKIETNISVGTPRRMTSFKRFVRRASVAFGDIRQRRS